MAIDLGSMFVKINANTMGLKTGLLSAGKSIGRFGGIAKIGAGIAIGAVAAIGTAAVVAGVKSVKAFADVEEGYAKVNTLLDDGMNAQDQYSDFVEKTNIAMGGQGDQLDVLSGLYQTISAGITDTAEAEEFMTAATMAAVGGSAELDDVILAGTKTMAAFGDEAGSAMNVMDKFAGTVKAGQTTMPELASAMPKVSGLAAEMGLSLDETLGTVAGLTKVLQDSDAATTGLQAVMTGFLKPSKALEEQLGKLGYESGQAMVEELGLMGALEKLNVAVDGDITSMGEMFQNVRALRSIAPALGAANEDIASSMDIVANSTGLAKDQYDKMAETAKFKVGAAMSDVKNTMVDMGDTLTTALMPVFSDFMTLLQDEVLPAITPMIEAFAEKLPDAIEWFKTTFSPMIEQQKEFALIIWDVVKVLFEELKPAIEAITPLITAIWDAMMPVLKIFGKLLIAGIKLASWLIQKLSPILTHLIENSKIVQSLKWLSANWDLIWASMKLATMVAWNAILDFIQWGVNGWLRMYKPLFVVAKALGLIDATPELDMSSFKKDTTDIRAEIARLKEEKVAAAVEMQIEAGNKAAAKGNGTIADYVAGGGALPGAKGTTTNNFNITTSEPEETANEVVARTFAEGA